MDRLDSLLIENSLERELRFTAVYAGHKGANPLLRETACLRVQVPEMFAPIQPGDWFAGRVDLPYVGLSPEIGGLGYYCRFDELRAKLGDAAISETSRADIENLLAFWQGRTTAEKCRAAFPAQIQNLLPSDDYLRGGEVSFPLYRIAGTCLDYAKLMRLGIPGLSADIRHKRQEARERGETDLTFFESLLDALELFREVAGDYAAHARRLSASALSPDRLRLETIASSLEHISERPPETFHQAVQLFWLYTLCSLSLDYSRMDVYLGDFLARDLDAGRIDLSQALAMTASLWQLIQVRGEVFNHRVIVGGHGRPNPANADRFALLALETQRQVAGNLPQLSLRWHSGMDPAVWQRALELLAGGSTYPILYNDDVNVPAVAKGFGVSIEEGEQYIPFGCGEYILDHRSLGTPNGTINLATLLNLTLNNGIDPFDGRCKGLRLGSLTDFRTFDDLFAAYEEQLEVQVGALAEAQAIIYRITGGEAAFPFLSILYDDCLLRGLPLFRGGSCYLGGTLETYGNNTAADALYAIRRAVFTEGLIRPEELLSALLSDFQGCERMRRQLANLPKFGNDDAEADAFNVYFNQAVLERIRAQAPTAGLHTYQAVLINNYMHVAFGRTTAASADGRRTGDPLSNGYQPGAGNDRSGPTALLNSMAKLDPALHAGAVHNLKFSREIFNRHFSEISALLEAYFESGGTQAMITVTSRGELEDAMRHPERYPHLMVRIGGYSERFVNLPTDIQLDIINRTLYDHG
jgi:pyruvate-formate lyase